MKFILTNHFTEKQQSVTRECIDRVKGKVTIDLLVRKVEQTGRPIEVHFEGDYDLKITN